MTEFVFDNRISTAWFLAQEIAPVQWNQEGQLELFAAHSDSYLALDVISAIYNCPLKVRVGDPSAIRQMILEKAASNRANVENLLDESMEPLIENLTPEILGDDPESPRIIRLVNTCIADAVELRASDIHLEPEKSGLKIRYRIDGILEDRRSLPLNLSQSIPNRIKVMARMDVSQRYKPQDGAFNVTFGGNPVDIRVSTVPTPAGERVVMRLLGRSLKIESLEHLGMGQEMIDQIDQILRQNQGLFLVAGPTGSGKTTSLYACLRRINTRIRNTITVEDPVEYEISNISQIQVGHDQNMGFADGLRTLLRQDPDVIMVGEIRDGDTAGTAFQAALTGHLILSTVHTTDPASAITRLLDLGVEPPLIAETLSAVMDQRLIRTICPHCAQTQGTNPQKAPKGCDMCRGSGFFGRIGLFRFMSVTQDLRKAIRSCDHQAVRDLIDKQCGDQLRHQAEEYFANGITTQSEIERVLGTGKSTG